MSIEDKQSKVLINWFPGHMAKAKREISESLKQVDLIVEVLDARAPLSSRNPEIKNLILQKPHIIVLNKSDLADREELLRIKNIYEAVYKTFVTNAKAGEGIESIKKEIEGYKVALAGPSGVGKSTIVNALVPEGNMETGDISDKTSRGKHTTRHVEILHCENGYVYDTP